MKLRKTTEFARDERGVVAIFIALSVPVIIAVSAFAIDYGYIASVQAQLRTASDAAALAAVLLVDDKKAAQETALEYAAKNMPADENGNVLTLSDVVLGHWSTSSETFTAGESPTNAIQVTTYRSTANGNPVELFFGPLISVPTVDVQSNTVAALLESSEESAYCFVALSSSSKSAASFSTTDTELVGCGLKSNSSSSSGMSFSGGTDLTVVDANVSVVGGIKSSGDPVLAFENAPVTGANAISDPYGDVNIPDFSGCDNTGLKVQSDTTLSPGVYCGGLNVNSNAVVTFDSGTYIILDGDLRFVGNAEISGDEVTFVFTGATAADIGSLTIAGNATVKLTAPGSGNFEGIIMYQDRDAPTSGDSRITGNAELTIDGSFYFPRQEIVITGGSTVEGNDECANFIGRKLSVGGNSVIRIDCDKDSEFAVILSTGKLLALLRS